MRRVRAAKTRHAAIRRRMEAQRYRRRLFKTIDKLPQAMRDLINEYDYDEFVRLYQMADGDIPSLRALLERNRVLKQQALLVDQDPLP
ncbi:hypothetical protein CcrKarma_gp159 [Caulobacter virus Karma]|uniref:Uncharacterized protein n=6 Tax=Viruses TaxID=10239 RepID=J3SMM5_9CAUD|nr:hypothetical protein D865_gp261 [Caulobacter phage phiCbK]YP_006988837.1 hypothetical protein CcrMagneto_gp155 [Caulobacter virus Magneto]YP_006989539.1 hypothetical protein CcrKarma_gp159 [Caulobacter virus Karma]YP_006989887.1 hypothetical protein D870_gp267 [Caulobacter phage CcrSwift]ARB14371.1 hypothetical protein Ccr5_gp151c [Caulobacter phage Ccr5]ARB15070.1 hypothetical protein Ccr32_gp152 [Caulobacter phage Ccr32]ARB15404.1 hypothetical protein Ccr34_gp162 [Caulobacter phage Ccr34